MSEVDALTSHGIVSEIMRVKARYVRALEERDWDLYAECLAEDVVASFAPAPGQKEPTQHRGRAHLRAWIPGALATTFVVIRVSSPDIEVIDVDRALGTWALVERLILSAGPDRERINYGHYHETYAREADGRWRISTIRIDRTRYDTVALDGTVTPHLASPYRSNPGRYVE